jgi:hypothetical protein
VPRQRGDGDAAAVVRNRERTPRVERLAILFFFFFLVKIYEERVSPRRFNERARVRV